MADFIAVIRRAVDGLSENTPDMRAKVYERAKSAVVRQLENMKPRPPEVMFQRQLDKLDAAIREVEAEHTEALPADDDVAANEMAVMAAAESEAVVPEPVAAVVTLPVAETFKAEPAPQPVETAVAAPLQERTIEAPAEISTAPQPVAEPTPVIEPEPVIPAYVSTQTPLAEPVARLEPETHPAQLDVQPYEALPEIQPQEAASAIETASEPVEAFVVPPAEIVYQPFDAPVVDNNPAPAHSAMQDTIETELGARQAAEPARQWSVDIDREPEIAQPEPAVDDLAPPMPKVSYDESDVVAGFNDFLKEEMSRKVVPPPPVRKADKQDDFSWDAPFDDLPEVRKPETFEKALEAKQKEIIAGAEQRKVAQPKSEPVSARAELEDLIGIEPAQRRSAAIEADTVAPVPVDVGRATSRLEGKSFKMQKKNKKSRSRMAYLPIALGVAGALVLGSAAYALWHYREDVTHLVASIMPTEETKTPADTVKTDIKSETRSPVVKTDTATDATQAKQPSKETEVASLNTDLGPQKFTQRLMPDGTEADTDAARVPVDQALQEGKSVAGQTEKGKEVAAATTNAIDAKSDATTTDAAKLQNDAQPIGATQKMFLYEERLGQTSPVAVPGTIVWKEKSDTEDGKPDPTIEGQIDIPERKITALLSIKRNTDASLPASHIIEIVFALPKNFEEGNVDSIQRVAFKQTEQDRGNPLIAVPAKITDDFHMVALNDDADARKVNLELMKTRSWIDIPITYRNGRRALITLEKGATGTAVFDKVLGEWDALGQQSNAQ